MHVHVCTPAHVPKYPYSTHIHACTPVPVHVLFAHASAYFVK